jgi:hypothetical protein
MLFKILIILNTLGATIWTGGHLLLSVPTGCACDELRSKS